MKHNQKPCSSLCKIDTTFERLLQEFPRDLIESAVKFEAFRRKRKIKNVEQLFQVVLLYCGLDFSLRDTAGILTRLGSQISDQAVKERLDGCAVWLSEVLKQMLPSVPAEIQAKVGRRWILIDGSTVQVPGACGTSYRIHLSWDWLAHRIVEIKITDAKTGESLKLYEIEAGDVVVADRGYARFADFQYVLENNGEVIIRYAPHQLTLVDEAGEKISLADELWETEKNIWSREVWMKKDPKQRKLHLHCFRLPPEKAAEARRRKKAKAKKDGRQLRTETLEYAEWTMIISSLPPSQISAAEIGEVYRLRWQIEIVIKRLKSLLQLDKLRAKIGSQLAKVYLLGKSIYALLIEKLSGTSQANQELEWRMWKMVMEQVRPIITQLSEWKEENKELAMRELRERKRHRKRQTELASELISVLFTFT